MRHDCPRSPGERDLDFSQEIPQLTGVEEPYGHRSPGKVLVTGGAGYIGAHTVKALLDSGYEVVVYDDLSRGHPEQIPGVPLVIGCLEDEEALEDVFSSEKFDSVIHFASESQVGESCHHPDKYFRRNVIGGLTLFSVMVKRGVKKLVFSSSAAVYGDPEIIPIPETHPINPKNPYGETKAFLERALVWYDRAYGLKSISLRYFNAAGADSKGTMGEDHDPETHLIPLICESVLTGKPLTVFGNDYPTPDGTAIRDYVHVTDLADAHVRALRLLESGGETSSINLGSGRGYSVLEVIRAVEEVTGKKVPYEIGPRRAGDPAVLVASCEKAKEVLGWEPLHSTLDEIARTAWNWYVKSHASS